MNTSIARLSEIADEVFDMMDAQDVFAHLSGDVKTDALELRLQEIMMGLPSFTTEELVMYLRCSYVASGRLPTWQPLSNRAYEQAKMRGEPDIYRAFYGLLPQEHVIMKNTGYPKGQQ